MKRSDLLLTPADFQAAFATSSPLLQLRLERDVLNRQMSREAANAHFAALQSAWELVNAIHAGGWSVEEMLAWLEEWRGQEAMESNSFTAMEMAQTEAI